MLHLWASYQLWIWRFPGLELFFCAQSTLTKYNFIDLVFIFMISGFPTLPSPPSTSLEPIDLNVTPWKLALSPLGANYAWYSVQSGWFWTLDEGNKFLCCNGLSWCRPMSADHCLPATFLGTIFSAYTHTLIYCLKSSVLHCQEKEKRVVRSKVIVRYSVLESQKGA